MSRYALLTNEELVNRWLVFDRRTRDCADLRDRIGFELTQRMEANEATALDHGRATVTLELGRPTWDYGRLAALREITAPEHLDGAYYAAHQETVQVSERWNMTKAKTLGRLGKEHQDILEAARIPGRGRLKIVAKETE